MFIKITSTTLVVFVLEKRESLTHCFGIIAKYVKKREIFE